MHRVERTTANELSLTSELFLLDIFELLKTNGDLSEDVSPGKKTVLRFIKILKISSISYNILTVMPSTFVL